MDSAVLYHPHQHHSMPINQPRTACSLKPILHPSIAYIRGEPVCRSSLVDLIGVCPGVWTPCRGLPLSPARGSAMHHARWGRLGNVVFLVGEGVAVICYHSGRWEEENGLGESLDRVSPS